MSDNEDSAMDDTDNLSLSGGEDPFGDGGADDDDDFFDDSVLEGGDNEFGWAEDKPKAKEPGAVVMDTNQIVKKQKDEVREVATVLSISEDEGEGSCCLSRSFDFFFYFGSLVLVFNSAAFLLHFCCISAAFLRSNFATFLSFSLFF